MIDKQFIIYKLANKYNLPLQTVSKVVDYQFKFITDIMKQGNFDAVRLPYFGKFSVNPNRLKYLQKKNDKKTPK